jgi:signal transduction histidine kinase
VVEEALTNAGKHGPAKQVTVSATRAGRTLRIEIVDDGPGIAESLGADGLPANARGLGGVTERLSIVGGSMRLTTGRKGTTVAVEVPLQ